ncbi:MULTISPECIES: hypothetical protein [Yersinia pseudotuberculosis complex]|uniref:hypothetical protein n=1 Tax=Yersinia pseudotuberculosis complex TaxID=1649845 RepID=UPI00031C6C06|nr:MULTISPECIES: hypothetical protein [Yersinia pseudotuberculosis complex]EKN4699637.1 hypothetical protein [Yersinia ruckeri]MCE4113181.1 hypothetical protein [Yersinia pseudotuberculosis]RYC26206.1 hypothetical protein EU971_11000 [Yersinia pseudotuberculosis]UFA64018.1 Uncharacterized protein YP598_4409 [Yersinia pseudotuberculosis]WLF06050.1 hypothetical protein Q6G25_21565 [Yersinia pseudotuberculosis]
MTISKRMHPNDITDLGLTDDQVSIVETGEELPAELTGDDGYTNTFCTAIYDGEKIIYSDEGKKD